MKTTNYYLTVLYFARKVHEGLIQATEENFKKHISSFEGIISFSDYVNIFESKDVPKEVKLLVPRRGFISMIKENKYEKSPTLFQVKLKIDKYSDSESSQTIDKLMAIFNFEREWKKTSTQFEKEWNEKQSEYYFIIEKSGPSENIIDLEVVQIKLK